MVDWARCCLPHHRNTVVWEGTKWVGNPLAIYDETWKNPLNGKLPLVYRNRT